MAFQICCKCVKICNMVRIYQAVGTFEKKIVVGVKKKKGASLPPFFHLNFEISH